MTPTLKAVSISHITSENSSLEIENRKEVSRNSTPAWHFIIYDSRKAIRSSIQSNPSKAPSNLSLYKLIGQLKTIKAIKIWQKRKIKRNFSVVWVVDSRKERKKRFCNVVCVNVYIFCSLSGCNFMMMIFPFQCSFPMCLIVNQVLWATCFQLQRRVPFLLFCVTIDNTMRVKI